MKKTGARPAASTSAPKRKAASRPAAKAAAKTGSNRLKKAGRAAPKTKTARRKTAARAAASRSSRKRPARQPPSALASARAAVVGAVAGAVAAVADRLPGRAAGVDPIALLETDHRRFEDLLKQGEETTARAVKGRTTLLDTLTAALNVHELIEEKVLYPALKSHPEAKDIVLEGFQEHHVADILVKELHTLAKDDEQWGAKFKVLKESLEHHIQEEESQMFRTARGVLSREQLRELGARMAEMKADAEGRS
ncbi:MAG: hemerythrin domain-containing protein [Acidobacteriota bacterium]